MGIPVLVLGFSGSGKSSSMRGFSNEEIGVFSVAGKRLPFKTGIKAINIERMKAIIESRQDESGNNARFNPYQYIMAGIKGGTRKAYAVDDSQYMMSFEEMDSDKIGFDKFNDIGFNFVGLVRFIRTYVDDSTIVYFLHHPEEEQGRIKPKTIGKVIDNHFTLEGLFEIVIMADVEKGEHVFRTQPDGRTPCKTPPGMLPETMPNDLKAVDAAIRDYWSLDPISPPAKEVEGDGASD